MPPTPRLDHRKLPRKKRPPTARDQALFELRQAKGWSQERIAREQGLSQSRVSQILRRVAAWREAQRPVSEQELAGEQERHQRRLERARQQELYERALRELDAAPDEVTTIRRTHRGQAVVCETTTRQQSPSVQWLRLALRAAEGLTQAAADPQPASQLRELTSALVALACEVDVVRQRLGALEADLGGEASSASNLTSQDLTQVAVASELGCESSAKSFSPVSNEPAARGK